MTPENPTFPETAALIDRLCNEGLSRADVARLEECLINDDAALQYYVECLEIESYLLCQPDTAIGTADLESTCSPATAAIPVLWSLDPLTSPPTAAFDRFANSVLPAYLLAFLVLIVGTLVGAFVHVSQPETAGQRGAATAGASFQRKPIGRITGMANCRFARGSFGALQGKVFAGDTFCLTAGAMEVAYETGARVILQGPVTFKTDSPSGGTLSVGKLTASIATATGGSETARDAARALSERSSKEPQSFTVRTPSAVLTDLGTEFAVVVEPSGETDVHVFVGQVAAAATDVRTGATTTVTLSADEGRHVRSNRGGVRFAPSGRDWTKCLRVMPQAEPVRTVLVSDDANRPVYLSGWRNDLGSGVGWAGGWLVPARSGNARHWIGSAGAIDVGGKSFNCEVSEGSYADAVRYFSFDDMPIGATFVIDFSHGKCASASTGFGLYNGKGERRLDLLYHGRAPTYQVSDIRGEFQDSGVPHCEKGLHVELTRTGIDTCELTLVRLDDQVATRRNYTFASTSHGKDIKLFRYFNGVSDGTSRSCINTLRVFAPASGDNAATSKETKR